MSDRDSVPFARRGFAKRLAAVGLVSLGLCSAATNAGAEPAAPASEPPAGRARVVEVFPGAPMAFRWIPPTTGSEWAALGGGDVFLMGSPDTETGRDVQEGPLTRVRLTRGFWMGQFEVTQEQWQAVMGYNPSAFRAAGPGAPVERVSWNDAQAFLRNLNRHSAASSPGAPLRFRLPTEAEWEYACRAGTTTAFAFGDAPDAARANFDDGRTERDPPAPRPVGSYEPNAWGLHDMHGNVWEWCENIAVFRLPGGTVSDPLEFPAGSARVVRGGSWFGDARLCRSAYRSAWQEPGTRAANIGFRVVMEEAAANRPEPLPPLSAGSSEDEP